MLLWYEDGYAFSIYAHLPKDELVKIAEKIEKIFLGGNIMITSMNEKNYTKHGLDIISRTTIRRQVTAKLSKRKRQSKSQVFPQKISESYEGK